MFEQTFKKYHISVLERSVVDKLTHLIIPRCRTIVSCGITKSVTCFTTRYNRAGAVEKSCKIHTFIYSGLSRMLYFVETTKATKKKFLLMKTKFS